MVQYFCAHSLMTSRCRIGMHCPINVSFKILGHNLALLLISYRGIITQIFTFSICINLICNTNILIMCICAQLELFFANVLKASVTNSVALSYNMFINP